MTWGIALNMAIDSPMLGKAPPVLSSSRRPRKFIAMIPIRCMVRGIIFLARLTVSILRC
jgi:hypothetical protein